MLGVTWRMTITLDGSEGISFEVMVNARIFCVGVKL